MNFPIRYLLNWHAWNFPDKAISKAIDIHLNEWSTISIIWVRLTYFDSDYIMEAFDHDYMYFTHTSR